MNGLRWQILLVLLMLALLGCAHAVAQPVAQRTQPSGTTVAPSVASCQPTARPWRSPTPTPNRVPAPPPGPPDRSGLAPTPVRVVDTAPQLPRRDEVEIVVRRPDCAREAYFVDPAKANAFVQQLPPGDRVVLTGPPAALMGITAPAPDVTPGAHAKPASAALSPPPTPGSTPPAPTRAAVATPTARVESATAMPDPSTTPVATPPGWNPSASANGLTLSVKPAHGGVGSGVRIVGSIAPNLLPTTPIEVEFWPAGPHTSRGDKSHTQYTGPVWPSRWRVRPGPNGHFTLDVVKVPRVIQTPRGDLWLIAPGAHDFALVLAAHHAVFAPFRVDPPPPLPTTLPPPSVQFPHLWLADAQTGWLIGARCQEPLPPTPDANGNLPPPLPPARCQGLIEGTTDGGQTWQEQYRGDVQVAQIQFVGVKDGWAIGPKGETCPDPSCPTALLQTTDGGATWDEISTMSLRDARIAFTSPTAGWLVGEDCPGPPHPTNCVGQLRMTTDGGRTWQNVSLPVSAVHLSFAHPTTAAGWIISRDVGPSPARLIVTHDGGKTWQTLEDPAAPGFAFASRLFFRTPTEGWLLAGAEGSAGFQPKAVYATTDGGLTWTKLAASRAWGQAGGQDEGITGSGYLGPMVFASDHAGWIASPRGGLLHSADGGRTWTDAPIKAHYFVDVHFADPKNGWALSVTGRALWATGDGGKSWRQIAFPTVGSAATPRHSPG